VVNRPRPCVSHANDLVPRTKTGKYSFPSGHTGSAFSTATVITLSSQNIYLAFPSYAYAVFVGYSRMRFGVHYTSDILGGMVIGIGSGLLTWQLDKMINGK
jgi:undecaprenyl-diphosphatase